MSGPLGVLAVMDWAERQARTLDEEADVQEARAAVAELVEAAERLAKLAESNIRSCGEVSMDSIEVPTLRAALAKFGGAA